MYYNLIASTEESTVLAQYVREERVPYGAYQSEAALERAFIRLLKEVGYAYLPIRDEAELIANLRTQLSALNDYEFTDVAGRKASKKTSNSFEFTSYWADAGNRLITDLMDFGRTFLARHTLRQAQPH